MVLGAAEGLDALAVLGAFAVNVVGDGRGADEADGLDGGVREDGVDRGLVAVDDVEDALGQAGFLEHLGEHEAGAGVALGGLEDEGVAAGDGEGRHPEGDHGGEVERGDAGDDAEGLAERPGVNAGAYLLGELAFEELGDASGELDVFHAAGGFSLSVGEDFPVLAVDEGGDFVDAALEDFAEAEHDAGAAERRLGGPRGEGSGGSLDGGVDFSVGGEGDAGGDLAGGGVEDVGEAAGVTGNAGAVDPMGNCGDLHGRGGACGGGCGGSGHGSSSFRNEAPMVAKFERGWREWPVALAVSSRHGW